MSNSVFQRVQRNGEIVNREYVIYSETVGKLFCAPCLLFQKGTVTDGNQFITGFDDWNNATKRLVQHGNSDNHKDCVIKLNQRAQK